MHLHCSGRRRGDGRRPAGGAEPGGGGLQYPGRGTRPGPQAGAADCDGSRRNGAVPAGCTAGAGGFYYLFYKS